MNKGKRQRIEEQLKMLEKRLSSAEEYIAEDVNVEGSSWMHMDDWRGRSGHPLWMRNFMILTVMKQRARKEKALEKIDDKVKNKYRVRLAIETFPIPHSDE